MDRPEPGSRVRITITGTAREVNQPEVAATGKVKYTAIRVRGTIPGAEMDIPLSYADEWEKLTSAPEPGEIWMCSYVGEKGHANRGATLLLFRRNNEEAPWCDSNGITLKDPQVTTVERVYPAV